MEEDFRVSIDVKDVSGDSLYLYYINIIKKTEGVTDFSSFEGRNAFSFKKDGILFLVEINYPYVFWNIRWDCEDLLAVQYKHCKNHGKMIKNMLYKTEEYKTFIGDVLNEKR